MQKNVAGIAELGVVFLLFLIGLELSYGRMLTMRRMVFGLGSLQVILTAAVLAGIAALAGNTPAVSVILGSCLALSSTAIVLEVLSGQRRLTTTAGRASFSILLAQDLAVAPILLFISVLGVANGSSVATHLIFALANAALALGFIVLIGRLLLRPLFRLVASTGTSELFVAATLFVIIGTGVASGLAGLPMALGAFVAGLLLAETEFEKAIQAAIEPFKGLLLGLFFFTVGMNIDIRELAREPVWLLASVFGLIGIKAILLLPLALFFRVPWPAAVETSLLLGPGGEFAFVGITLATTLGLMSAGVSSFALAVTSLTMALIPLLSYCARRLRARLEQSKPIDPALAVIPPAVKGRAIVVGHGRVGQVVCAMLERHQFPFVAIDSNSEAVSEYRRRGREVYYGDATDAALLESCGIFEAAAVIVTIHSRAEIDEIVERVRLLREDIIIVSRAKDAAHARHLYAIGVTDAVPETIEASLQLSEAALVSLGLATGPVIASIHAMRDVFRQQLQQAAGKTETRSIRAKMSGHRLP
jgi:CPA2 family monovalent cation:H+ antiporter-2